jgi:hypothetical protein
MRRSLLTIGVAVTAAAVIAAGCSSTRKSGQSIPPAGSGSTSMSMPMPDSSGPSANAPDAAPAAQLRSTLTALLEDHVWLAGNALDTAVRKGGKLNDPAVKGAVAALDTNSVDLSQAVGSVFPAAQKPFLTSWRQHIGFFVDYTLGKATKNQTMVSKAEHDLDGYRTAFGQLINSVVPSLPASAVADELKPHVQTLLAAIDADVAGRPGYQALLTTAADHMVMTADVLAGGIAKTKNLAGDVDGTASATRATLTGQLDDHVWLAGNALDTAVQKGGNLGDPAVKGAVAALDANSVALSKTVGSVYPSAEKPFLASWRQHIGFFVDYTLGKATKNQAMVSKARADLAGYAKSFGQLLNSVISNLPASAVESELTMHVSTLLAAIDASVAKAPNYQTLLTTAAQHMPGTAEALTAAIVVDKHITN